MGSQLPLEPPDFRGKPREFLAWAGQHEAGWNPSWCPRHWLPCPVDGRNGVLATVKIMHLGLELMPADVAQGGALAMNSWLANQTSPICCRLGDERMQELWADC